MPWAKPTYFTSWSFSRLQAYRKCPLAAKLSMLDKIKEPPKLDDHPMVRGDRIHKLAEGFMKGTGSRTPVPEELSRFSEEFRALRRRRRADTETVVVEETWAFRKDWTLTTFDDWDKCWLRVKLDIAELDNVTLKPIDIKTGKFSPEWNLQDYLEQLELYALAGLLMYADVGPELKVIPRLWYTDQGIKYPDGKIKADIYTPDMVPELKKKWEKTVKPMMADRTFAAKPNRFCSSCFYRKGNDAAGGGQCKFN